MACPPHPYGIKPCGQAYLERFPDARAPGLGHMAALSDELLLSLLYLLPAADLQRLGMASKALYAFAHYDELWKALLLEVGSFSVWDGAGSWGCCIQAPVNIRTWPGARSRRTRERIGSGGRRSQLQLQARGMPQGHKCIHSFS